MAESNTRPTATSVPAFLDAVDNDSRRADAIALEEMMALGSGGDFNAVGVVPLACWSLSGAGTSPWADGAWIRRWVDSGDRVS